MKVTAEMKIKDVLKINERMIEAFVWLAPEFERLRNPTLRRLMSWRVTVSQASRVAHIPLTEALYVLNLAAGEDVTAHQDWRNCPPMLSIHDGQPSAKTARAFGVKIQTRASVLWT